MLSLLWLACFALASYRAYGDYAYFPSLKSLQQKDTALVLPLLKKGENFLQINLDSAAFYMLQAEAIALQLEYKKGYLDFASTYIQVLNRQGKYAAGLQLSKKALDIAQTLQNKSFMAVAYNNISHQYTSLGNLELALKNELEALKIAETLGDSSMIRKLTNNLSSTYLDLRDQEKSYIYANRAYELALQLKDSLGIASSLVNLANSEIINEKYEEAEGHLNALLHWAGQINDPSYELDALINLAHLQSELHHYQKALDYHKKGLLILENYQVPDYIMYIHWGLAESYHNLGLHDKADFHLTKSLETGKSLEALKELRYMYLLGADIKEQKSELASALDFRKKYEILNDSILGKETRKNMQKLEIEYEMAEKEKELAQQQLQIALSTLQIQARNKWIIVSVAVIVALILLLVLMYVVDRNKRKRSLEKLNLLEKEKEIRVLEAMIEGEEKERSRLAKELHDGVGGILSASKMHLSILKNHTEDQELQQGLSLIDTASSEIRNIAHNLAPEFLVKYGIDKALEIYCKRVSNRKLQVLYYRYGEIPKLELNFQMAVYRIVQELINNAMKHSQGKQAVVQMNIHAQAMNITVEDNGTGLSAENAQGIGLMNLKARVAAMSGVMDIDARPGEGTSILLEFDMNSHITSELSTSFN